MLRPEDIDIETVSGVMYTAGQKDPDFILRPSGDTGSPILCCGRRLMRNLWIWTCYGRILPGRIWTGPLKNTIPAAAASAEFESKARHGYENKSDYLRSRPVVVLFAVMALFDTFVFNVVIAAICSPSMRCSKAFRFEKAAYIYWGFVPYTLLVMFSDFHMVRICMLPASYIFALYLVLCVIGNSKSINYAKLGGMVLFSCIIMFCFYSLIYLKQLLPRATYGYDALYFIFLILGFAWGGIPPHILRTRVRQA